MATTVYRYLDYSQYAPMVATGGEQPTIIRLPDKQSADNVDYTLSLVGWLTDCADSIEQFAIKAQCPLGNILTVSNTNGWISTVLSQGSPDPNDVAVVWTKLDNGQCSFLLSGGRLGTWYDVFLSTTTLAGRTINVNMRLFVLPTGVQTAPIPQALPPGTVTDEQGNIVTDESGVAAGGDGSVNPPSPS